MAIGAFTGRPTPRRRPKHSTRSTMTPAPGTRFRCPATGRCRAMASPSMSTSSTPSPPTSCPACPTSPTRSAPIARRSHSPRSGGGARCLSCLAGWTRPFTYGSTAAAWAIARTAGCRLSSTSRPICKPARTSWPPASIAGRMAPTWRTRTTGAWRASTARSICWPRLPSTCAT